MPWRINQLTETASTNDDVKRAAEAGEAEGLVICAARQTAGRGRHGRAWESPQGNLYCSVLLRPNDLQNAGRYSFVAAMAFYDTVRQCLPIADITLKWPNDVLVEDEKIAGILLEAGPGWLVIGMGLNILHHPETALYPATSLLAAGGGDKPLDEILDMLLQNVDHWYGVMQKEGFAPVRAAWLKRAHKGRLSVRLSEGTLEGVFADLDAEGRLGLRLADGSERAISSGDVWLGAGRQGRTR